MTFAESINQFRKLQEGLNPRMAAQKVHQVVKDASKNIGANIPKQDKPYWAAEVRGSRGVRGVGAEAISKGITNRNWVASKL